MFFCLFFANCWKHRLHYFVINVNYKLKEKKKESSHDSID